MRIPRIKKRRFYDIKIYGKTCMESDKDMIANNIDLVMIVLEGLQNKTLKIQQIKKPQNKLK